MYVYIFDDWPFQIKINILNVVNLNLGFYQLIGKLEIFKQILFFIFFNLILLQFQLPIDEQLHEGEKDRTPSWMANLADCCFALALVFLETLDRKNKTN